MYAINIKALDENEPVIDRSMSSNNVSELIPVVIQICKARFAMRDPVALYMGHNVYRIFDIDNPREYAKISIIKNAN